MDIKTNLNRYLSLLKERNTLAHSPQAQVVYTILIDHFERMFGPMLTPPKEQQAKPYFAKYLPVGGNFWYLGARIRDKKTGDIGIVKKIGEGLDETTVEHVKLFLCSRDIQVGDDIYDNVGRFWKNCEECFFRVMKEQGYGFKKIGEISPEATWVKEGDEFEMEDLQAHGLGPNWNDSDKGLKFKVRGLCGKFH